MTPVSQFASVLPPAAEIQYPTSDGRPMGETDLHRNIMFAAIETLKQHYAGQQVYVSGNILLFYRPGNRRRHVSPDVLVVHGLEQRDRENYLLWEEGRPPNFVLEVTSASTRGEDLEDKFELYRDVLQVAEYFLFDPRGEYLCPALQGYRLSGNEYLPIASEADRLPSRELGLHLEQRPNELRFYDPTTRCWLPTVQEARDMAVADQRRAEAERQQAQENERRAEAERQQAQENERRAEAERQRAQENERRAVAELQRAVAEAERWRQELDLLRRRADLGR